MLCCGQEGEQEEEEGRRRKRRKQAAQPAPVRQRCQAQPPTKKTAALPTTQGNSKPEPQQVTIAIKFQFNSIQFNSI